MYRREQEKKIDEILGNLEANDRREFFRRLRDADLFQSVFNNISEGIAIFDRNLEIRFVNNAAREILGMPENFTGQKISSYIKDFDWEFFLGAVRSGQERISRQEIEIDYPHRKILLFYIIQQKQEKDSFVGIFHDITELADKKNEENEKARNELISLLAAGVAHEIGNPLNSISIQLQLLEKRLSGGKKKFKEEITLLRNARSEISRLENILKRFLQAIRMEKPNFIKTDVKKLIFESLRIMKFEIENRRINVNCDFDSIPAVIMADEEQIKQAFYNIIKNGVDAMPEGGQLNITCSNEDDFVRISFKDNGHGISPENLGKIFNPYFSTKKSGSGLGLMIVERIIREHKGKLSVDSSPEKGTCFHIYLPIFGKLPKMLTGKKTIQLEEK